MCHFVHQRAEIKNAEMLAAAEALCASAAKTKSLCGSSDQILNAAGSINKRGLYKHNLGVSSNIPL